MGLDAGLVREVQLTLLSGCAYRLLSQFRVDWVVDRSRAVSEMVVRNHADRAIEIARLLSGEGHGLLSSSDVRAGSYIDQAATLLRTIDQAAASSADKESEVKVGSDQNPDSVSAEVTAETKEPQGAGDGEQKTGSRRRQPKSPPSEVAAKVDVGISQLGLPNEVIEKLLDLGVGTSVQALEYDASHGLRVQFGDEVALAILAAIESYGADDKK